jgi:hypothetical protein
MNLPVLDQRVGKGETWVGHGSVEGGAWLSLGWGMAQLRVGHGSVEGGAWLSRGWGMAQLGWGMAQLVACRAAVRRPRVRISARHPIGGPLPELAAMKKLERNSTNVMNECV